MKPIIIFCLITLSLSLTSNLKLDLTKPTKKEERDNILEKFLEKINKLIKEKSLLKESETRVIQDSIKIAMDLYELYKKNENMDISKIQNFIGKDPFLKTIQ